jgi:hypothetical protein
VPDRISIELSTKKAHIRPLASTAHQPITLSEVTSIEAGYEVGRLVKRRLGKLSGMELSNNSARKAKKIRNQIEKNNF